MGRIIASVSVRPECPRPWEPVLVEVLGADGRVLSHDLDVWIGRTPGARQWLQLRPGRASLVVTARHDGETERIQVDVEVSGEPVLHVDSDGGRAPALLTVRGAPDRPYRVAITLSPRGVRVRTPEAGRRLSARALDRIGIPTLADSPAGSRPGLSDEGVAALSDLLARARPPRERQYEWDFGDGTTAVTRQPFVEHDYTDVVDHPRRASSFDVRCRVSGEEMEPVEVTRSLVLDSWYAQCRQRGHIVCPVDAADLTSSFRGTAQGRFVIHNPEDQALTFDRISLVALVADPADEPGVAPIWAVDHATRLATTARTRAPRTRLPRTRVPRTGTVPLPKGDHRPATFRPLEQAVTVLGRAATAALVHPAMDELPDEAFGYSVLLAGHAADGTPAHATAVFDLPLGDRLAPPFELPVAGRLRWPWDRVAAAVGASGRRGGAVTLEPVAEDDVRIDRAAGFVAVALAPEGGRRVPATGVSRLSAIDELLDDAVAPLDVTARKGEGTLEGGPPVEGGPCDPWNITPPDAVVADAASLACQLTGTELRRTSGKFVNARKGDIILSPGAGSPMALLYQHMDPPQAHSHAGIMTRNYDEIAHSFGSGEWLAAELERGIEEDGEINTSALQVGWPGAVAQHTENAVDGEDFTDTRGRTFEISAITPGEVGVDFLDGFRVTPALVLKPSPLLETAEVRARLAAAADAARAQCGSVGADGATVQSGDHFSFFSFTDGAFVTPVPGSGEWPAGTVPSACSTFIRRVLAGAKVTFEQGQGDPAMLETVDLEAGDHDITDFGGAAEVREGGVDGLYVYSAGERADAGHALQDHLLHLAEEAVPVIGELIADVAEPFTNILLNVIASNQPSMSEAWHQPGEGVTVSPDDMLFWDGVESGGSYGFFEPLIYRQPRSEWVDVHAWQRYTKTGRVHGVATLDGQPFAGATVFCWGLPQTTKADGRFDFDHVPYGPTTVDGRGTGPNGRSVEDTKSVTVAGTEEVHLFLDERIDERFRLVTVELDFFGRDDEWGDDETVSRRTSLQQPVGPGDKVVLSRTTHDWLVVFRWGGECRAEYKLTLETGADHSVDVAVNGRFFEGITESTKEQEDCFGPTTVSVPADGEPVHRTFQMDNEGDDWATLHLTLTNAVAQA